MKTSTLYVLWLGDGISGIFSCRTFLLTTAQIAFVCILEKLKLFYWSIISNIDIIDVSNDKKKNS